ncbi:MAG: IMP cyclohydrolase, partial [Dehalococcoidales bacterium]|nr:IMP cyclohydrolase [Dehalococcoidales bacterium]
MKNPNGPYPGRQIFLGRTPAGNPAFAYLVTGRSPASRERRATPAGNGIIMGAIGGAMGKPKSPGQARFPSVLPGGSRLGSPQSMGRLGTIAKVGG